MNNHKHIDDFIVVQDEFGYYFNQDLATLYQSASIHHSNNNSKNSDNNINNSQNYIKNHHHKEQDLSQLNKEQLINFLNDYQCVDIQTVSDSLKDDRDIALLAVNNQGDNIYYLSARLQHDKAIFIQALKHSPFLIHDYWNDSLRDDKDVVMQAVKKNGHYFTYASSRLQHDRDVAFTAVTREPLVLKSLPEQFQLDKEIVLYAVSHCAISIEYMHPQLNDDQDIILAAINQPHCGKFIKYASERIKNDKQIGLIAVRSNGFALRFLSLELRNDQDVALAALSHNIKSLKSIGPALKERIGSNDPVDYLTKLIMTDSLDKKLNNQDFTQSPKFKL